eukprot:140281_1
MTETIADFGENHNLLISKAAKAKLNNDGFFVINDLKIATEWNEIEELIGKQGMDLKGIDRLKLKKIWEISHENETMTLKKLQNDNKTINIQLTNLKHCKPIKMQFNKTTTIDGIKSILCSKLGLCDNRLYFIGNDKIPLFRVMISDKNCINLEKNIFTISSTTLFIEYYNDLLDVTKRYDRKITNKLDNIKYKGNANVCLLNDQRTLHIGPASISFQRTLRIPDDDKTYPLPPSLGQFEIVKVKDYMNNDGLPPHWAKRNGVIIGMWQKEALWMYFKSTEKCVLKVGVGNVNAISGKSWRSGYLSRNKQNYVVIPKQKWLDGINCGDGYIRQFVAMQLGNGYTVEAQIPKTELSLKSKYTQNISRNLINNNNNNNNNNKMYTEDIGGIQLEIY